MSVDSLDPAPALDWLQRFGVAARVSLLQGQFADVVSGRGPFEMVFVDGEHDTANVRADLEVALAALEPGGVLACHDYPDPDWPDVRKIVDAVAAERGLVRFRQADYVAAFRYPGPAAQRAPEPLIRYERGAADGIGPGTLIPRTVWAYWEGPLPGYIDLCLQTIRKHNVRVEVLDRAGFDALHRSDRDLPIDTLPLAQKADFIRAYLLKHYGGLYVDADCIVLRNLDFVFDAADAAGFVGYREPLGYMSNSFMATAPGGAVIESHYRQVCDAIRSRRPLAWLDLGSVPLERSVADHRGQSRLLPTELVMPLSWQHSERLADRRSDEEHEASFRAESVCYMLSNNTIKNRSATVGLVSLSPAELLADSYFLSFLFRRAFGDATT